MTNPSRKHTPRSMPLALVGALLIALGPATAPVPAAPATTTPGKKTPATGAKTTPGTQKKPGGTAAPVDPKTGKPLKQDPGKPGQSGEKKPDADPSKKDEDPAGQQAHPSTTACQVSYQPGRNLKLQQPWELYADRGGATSYASVKDRRWGRVRLPANFRDSSLTKNFKGQVWYRCAIMVSDVKQVRSGLGLYLGLIMEADIVSFNGVRVGSTGRFETRGNFEKTTQGDVEKLRLYSLPRQLWRSGENLIVVRVMGIRNSPGLFGSRTASGIHSVPELVNESERARALIFTDTPAIVLSCVYMLVSLFFALFAAFFWHRKENLFFALFSFFLGLYHLIRTKVRYDIFDDFHFSYKIELLILLAIPVCFMNFLIHLIRIKTPLPAIIWQVVYAGLFLITLLAQGPAHWDMVIEANLVGLAGFIGITVWVILKNLEEHKRQLRYLLLGLVPVLPALLNDMLVAGGLYNGPRLVVFAFLIFMGFVALQLSDSVLELYRNLQEQENELRQLEKRKTSSIFNISSEFRQIFDELKESVDVWRNGKGPSPRKVQTQRKKLNTAVANLRNFINDSNLLPLLESNEYTARKVRFSLSKLSEQVVERATMATGQPIKRVSTGLPEDAVEMTGDPDLISTAIYHMVENALLYTEGQVELSVEKDSHALTVIVRDEGPGLSEEQKHLVFQKFVRGVDDMSDIPGIGVGLTIVQLIARKLGGSFRLEGGGGFYSTFVLALPLQADQRVA